MSRIYTEIRIGHKSLMQKDRFEKTLDKRVEERGFRSRAEWLNAIVLGSTETLQGAKIYVVTNDANNNCMYLVKAKNKKDAIDKVFKQHFEWQNAMPKERGYRPFTKSMFEATELNDMFIHDIVELN